MNKPEWFLLASAPSLEAMQEAISRFYGGESKTLIPNGEDEWEIVQTVSGKKIVNARVRRTRGRFRFEGGSNAC